MTTLINGRVEAKISANDRGLLFGDGLFETMAFRESHCPLWDRHMQRLQRGCRMLGIDLPDLDRVDAECRQLATGDERVVVRLTLTRGRGGRGYWPDPAASPTRIIQQRPWPEALEKQHRDGLKAITSSVSINVQPVLAGLKHCNRIEQILAAQECQGQGAEEALVFDQNDHLAEAVSSNLLLRIRGDWITPSSPAAVAGVGLEWLLDHSPIDIQPRGIERAELSQADSILVINSIGGIRPLSHLDQHELIIDSDCRRFQRYWNQKLISVCDDC